MAASGWKIRAHDARGVVVDTAHSPTASGAVRLAVRFRMDGRIVRLTPAISPLALRDIHARLRAGPRFDEKAGAL